LSSPTQRIAALFAILFEDVLAAVTALEIGHLREGLFLQAIEEVQDGFAFGSAAPSWVLT